MRHKSTLNKTHRFTQKARKPRLVERAKGLGRRRKRRPRAVLEDKRMVPQCEALELGVMSGTCCGLLLGAKGKPTPMFGGAPT